MHSQDFGVAFNIGKFPIYWYALMFALGIVAAVLITDTEAKRRGLSKDMSLDICIIGIPLGVIGARFFAVVAQLIPFSDIVNFTKPGMVLWGALLLGFAGIAVYCRLKKLSLLRVMDSVLPALLVGIAIGRWGDFFNRSAYGPLVENISLQFFPLATYAEDGSIHYAAFFYEFILLAAAAVALLLISRKRKLRDGRVFMFGAIAYAVANIIAELVRVDRAELFGVKFNILISAVIVIVMAIVIVLRRNEPLPDTIDLQNDEDVPESTEAEPEEDDGENTESSPVSDSTPEEPLTDGKSEDTDETSEPRQATASDEQTAIGNEQAKAGNEQAKVEGEQASTAQAPECDSKATTNKSADNESEYKYGW